MPEYNKKANIKSRVGRGRGIFVFTGTGKAYNHGDRDGEGESFKFCPRGRGRGMDFSPGTPYGETGREKSQIFPKNENYHIFFEIQVNFFLKIVHD